MKLVKLLGLLALIPGCLVSENNFASAKEKNMPVLIPMEGTSHPVFQRLNEKEIVDIYLTFDPSRRKQESTLGKLLKAFGTASEIMKPFNDWKISLLKSISTAAVDHDFKADCLNVVLGGVAQPASAIDKLIDAYR